MRKGKMYKKFLSCVLAAAVVVTSGVVYPTTGKAESVTSTTKETEFQDNTGKSWYIVRDYLAREGVIQDAQGILYQLQQDGKTAIVIGFEYKGNSSVTIPSSVPINYTNYKQYIGSEKTPKEMPKGTDWRTSEVTEIEVRAFSGSSQLKEITVPDSVVNIRDEAFTYCSVLEKLFWEVSGGKSVVIGKNILNSSPECIFTSNGNEAVNQYAQDNGYDVPREEATPNPSESTTPSATPSEVPSTIPSSEPSAAPSNNPSTVPSIEPSAKPSTVPTATPVAAPSMAPTPAVATPVAPTATPKVSGHPSLPVVVPSQAPTMAPAPTTPVVQTPEPTVIPATTAPTAAPTEAVTTPAPASQAPAVTEVPAITEAPTVTAAPEKPSEATSVPVQPTIAPVPETVVKNNVSYEVNQGAKSVSVSNMNTVKTSKVTIPSTVKIDGVSYKVTSVDKNAFKNNTKIKTVQLGKNVTKIDAGAFQGCKNLTSVKFPSKLKTISKNSFNGCSSLKTVEVPKTVTKIGKASFKNCTSLKTFSIGDNPEKKAGGLSFDESQIRYGASTVTINIGAKAFENCKKLNKVIINALVKIIGKSAFKDCKSLRSVLIYSKVLKKVKGGALTGVNNCKISVPAKKVAPYKILFKNKGQGKKVVVAKL